MIFVHGCFWHGHEGCKYFKIPGTRTEWWREKIEKNRQNDKKAAKNLQKENWAVIVINECQLKKDKINKTLYKCVMKMFTGKHL